MILQKQGHYTHICKNSHVYKVTSKQKFTCVYSHMHSPVHIVTCVYSHMCIQSQVYTVTCVYSHMCNEWFLPDVKVN